MIFVAANARADCISPPSGVVGWWPGDGAANDIIIGGNNGTLQGNVTFAPGMVGQAFSFDGSSYLDASDSNLPVGNSSATISAWINTNQTGEQYFISWGSRIGCGGTSNEIALGAYQNHLILESCGGHVESSTIVNDGAWHHVVGVWYGSNTATLYVDGVQQTDTSTAPLPSIDIISSGHLNIGQLVQAGINFNGLVDEVQIYNRPLSESEIQTIYNAGSAGVCKPQLVPGDLFESDSNSGTIYKFAPDGTRSTFTSGLNHPTGLAFDSAGNLFESDSNSGTIYKFAPDGAQSTFATGLNGPIGLAFDSAGNLFEADYAQRQYLQICSRWHAEHFRRCGSRSSRTGF